MDFKKNVIKNSTWYYFDDIMRVGHFDILLDKKMHENSLIYDISCKAFMDTKPLIGS